MKPSNTVVWLSSLIVLLALVAAAAGLFYQDGGSQFSFTTVRGETVQIYGQGLYRYDTPLTAVGYRVSDAVTLVFEIPLLVVSVLLYRRGSLRGRVLLSGILAYFLYNYGSIALGAAYNNLFLVYLALFSASLYAFVLSLMSFDLAALPSRFALRLPRRGIGIYLIISGLILLLIWLMLSILPGLLEGKAPPEVASYTTVITFVVDMGVVAPALILAGILLLRRRPLGYLLASMLLVFTVALGIPLLAMGIAQFLAGLTAIGQFIGFTVSFAILTLFAIWFTIVLLRSVSGATLPQATRPAAQA